MKSISYRTKLLTIYTLVVSIILILIYDLFTTLNLTNVGNISKENLKNQTLQKEKYLQEFFYPYITTLKAIQKNPFLEEYFTNGNQKKYVEETFLSIKKSLPCLTQVRYIDLKGDEKIRIDGTPIAIFQDKAISKIVPKNKLQNKADRPYVQKFFHLDNNKIGLSFMNLNKKHNKIGFPKQPILRIGIAALDKNHTKQGIIVLNICLRSFFTYISRSTLYNIYLIDGKGNFLNHHNSKYGLLGDNNKYTIFNEFPTDAKAILQYDEYFGNTFFAKKITRFNNGQDLRIILQYKYQKQLEQRQNVEDSFIIFIFIFIALAFPLALYFARLPDKLAQKAQQDKLISKLTHLPNRIALMEDLMKQNFKDSIIILISVNNIIKIQNTYGYEISNEIIQKFALYMQEFSDKNILKIYNNSYNTFTLKYHYQTNTQLQKFLKKLIANIENHPFQVSHSEFEFLLEITLGVSNPEKLNNNIEELNEAENALEYALEKHLQLEIYSASYKKNIEQKKHNILLAKKIKNAIEKNDVILYYQPIYNNMTEKIEKYESLIRIQSENVLLYPDTFLSLAKQINQYNTLSYMVIDKACHYFQDKDYEFSINLSVLDIENDVLQDYLFERINYYGVTNKIVIEIVEQEGIDNYDNFFAFIKKVKEVGCKVAIDDFGSGYSNFEYIINLSEYIDYLKLDGSLVKSIASNPKSQILIGSLKFLCDNLQIKTIAEFVENEEILHYLQSIGIDYSQGYYIGKPGPTVL